jgi:Uncharacterized protein conserved in bacteria
MAAGGDTSYTANKAADQWDRYVYMRDTGHTQFIEKADKCVKFFQGIQWDKADLDKLMSESRPALTINKIISTLSTIMGEQIFNRMEVSFRPKNGAPAEMADVLNKLWMHDANANQLNWVRSDIFAHGAITSRGFYDVRVSFDDNLRGDVVITKVNPKNVLIDPDAEDYDPDKWDDVIVTKWLNPNHIRVMYGEDQAKELEGRAMSAYLYGYDSIERKRDRFASEDQNAALLSDKEKKQRRFIRVLDRQYREATRVKLFVDPINGDTREIPVQWDRNRIVEVKAKYGLEVIEQVKKKVKWCVTADDLVLHEDWSPLDHFTIVPYFPYFLDGKTIGFVENLLGSQELLNKASSQELHVINTTANSGWKVKKGALANMSTSELEQRGAETGLVIEVNDDVNNVEKILPNQIPSGLERITFKAEEHIKTISNVSDYMAGFAREDVSSKSVIANQNRGSVNLAKPMDNLERSDWILARNVLSIWQRYYTEPRIINVTHDNLVQDPEIIQLNQQVGEQIINDLTIGEFETTVISAPYRATMEDSQFEQAVALKELGVAIPDDVLIENSRLSRKAEIAKRIRDAANSPETQAAKDRQVRMQEAEISSKEAETLTKTTKAKLDNEKAATESGKDGSAEHELAIAKLKADNEMAIAKMKAENEIQIANMKAEADIEIKRKLADAQEMEIRARAAAMPADGGGVKQPSSNTH